MNKKISNKDDDDDIRNQIMILENNQNNYLNNSFLKRKRNKTEGENLQYLKIKLYRDGKFLIDFTPKLINTNYRDDIIFPSDFLLEREQINKTIYNKKILREDDDELDEDINLVNKLDKSQINKLRFENPKGDKDIQEIIKKNIQYLIHAYFQHNTILNINGLEVQLSKATIIDKNNDIHNTIIAKIEDRKILNDYKKNNQDYYIKYIEGDSTIHNKVSDMENTNNYLNNTRNFIFRSDESVEERQLKEEENLLSIGGYNFYIAIDVKISTDKVLKKSKFKGIISPFASCKTKRAALSEVLDYNINLFETQYLKINKDKPLLTESLPPKPSNQIKKVKGGRSKKKTKKIRRIRIRKKLSRKRKKIFK